MKHVLITGGTDGLGKVTAEKLVNAGYEVTILGKYEVKTRQVAEEIGCKSVIADVADAESVWAAIQPAGSFDVLINNAGIWIQGALEENSHESIKRTMEVNAVGAIYVTQVVIDDMKPRKQGRIINVISQAGLSAKAERAVYNASKWAMTGFTKSLQAELKPCGISVVGFYPGALNNSALFEKAGNGRDMSRALDLGIAADALVYLCGLPNEVDVPEFGIQSLNY